MINILKKLDKFTVSIAAISIAVNIFSIFINGTDGLNGISSAQTLKIGGMSNDTPLYTLITSIFVHRDCTHLITNLALFITTGNYVYRTFGNKVYISTFFISGLVGNLVTKFVSHNVSGGISGCVYGLIALSLLSSFEKGTELYKIRWLYTVIVTLLVFSSFILPNVNAYSHILGFVVGAFAYCIYSTFKIKKEVVFK